MTISVTLITKRVTAVAHVRSVVTANIREPSKAITLNVPARRGPPGGNTAAVWKMNEW